MMTENDKICPLGLDECTSIKNKESCQGKFYKCNKVNTSKYYLDCIKKFLSDPDIIHIGEKNSEQILAPWITGLNLIAG